MKIQYASDIHLEFSDNLRFVKGMPFDVVGDILILAGDTGYLSFIARQDLLTIIQRHSIHILE